MKKIIHYILLLYQTGRIINRVIVVTSLLTPERRKSRDCFRKLNKIRPLDRRAGTYLSLTIAYLLSRISQNVRNTLNISKYCRTWNSVNTCMISETQRCSGDTWLKQITGIIKVLLQFKAFEDRVEITMPAMAVIRYPALGSLWQNYRKVIHVSVNLYLRYQKMPWWFTYSEVYSWH